MSNININTSIVGTFNINYIANDESDNISESNRNIYILPNINNPYINLKSGNFNINRMLIQATKPGSSNLYTDPGFIAYDQYNNSSEDFELIKNLVTIEHRRHSDKNDDTGILIYSEVNGNITIPNVVDSGKINTSIKPEYLFLFINGDDSNFYNSDWAPDNLDYQTAYFSIKYILNIPGYNSVSVTRKIYITDTITPLISLANITNPEQVVRFDNFTDNVQFNKIESYWYFDDENIPNGFTSGFTTPKSSIAGSIIIKDPSGNIQSSINTSIIGIWTIFYRFFSTYSTINLGGTPVNNANFIFDTTLDLNYANSDFLTKSYLISRQVVIGDSISPIIELKKIGNSLSNPITFGSNNSGKIYTEDDSIYGDNYNMYFYIPLESSDKPTLEDVLPNIYTVGEFNSNNIPSGNSEVIIRDNAGSSQIFNVTVNINRPPNFSMPSNTPKPNITRNLIGTDFNDAYNYTFFPVGGTVSNPAEYIITYTVKDQSNNSSNISRRLYIIDRSIPDIIFNTFTSPISSSTINDGLIYNKGSTTTGFSQNKILVSAYNASETTYVDEFGDIILKNVSFQSPPNFVNSYIKSRPYNTYLLEYNSNVSKYTIKTFYNLEVLDNIYFAARELTINPDSSNTFYSFDVSHSSLTNRGALRFKPESWGSGVSNTYTGPNSYTPQGTYHSYFTINFLNSNQADQYSGLVKLQEYNSSSSQWVDVSITNNISINTYDPNTNISPGGGIIIK